PLVRATATRAQEQETPMSRLLFLKRVPLFQELSLDDLLALDGALRRVDFLPEEVIFEEGTVGDDFYLVSEGEVSVRTGRGEQQVERARLKAGDFFGEMALFDDEPRSATCVAASACALLALDRGRFHSLIAQLPALGLAICKTLTQRLRRTELDLRAARAAKSA
ncbi:MAG: cyclic nucleotide-binding domain-containing protein, partial [Thermoanaerobaculia bacterium]|nr:cyclic nucleotide-binding domain-containing protein [Thermoanaerobaculia bacterium]